MTFYSSVANPPLMTAMTSSNKTYLLDTNICIYIINQRPKQVLNRLMNLDPAYVAISVVTWSELMYGVYKSQHVTQNLGALRKFILPFEILSWGPQEAQLAGQLRAQQEHKGQSIGPFDLQIAAQALVANRILVTNNQKEFKQISGLQILNWV